MSYKARAKSEGVSDGGGSLMCHAHDCPMKWSVNAGTPLCSYHAWADEKQWPSITESLRRSGPWLLRDTAETDTVRDMKTRMRKGFKFTAPELEAA